MNERNRTVSPHQPVLAFGNTSAWLRLPSATQAQCIDLVCQLLLAVVRTELGEGSDPR